MAEPLPRSKFRDVHSVFVLAGRFGRGFARLMVGLDEPSTAKPDNPELSIVIPFFNEAPNVAVLLGELRETLNTLGVSAEVLAVNDGSTDATATEIDRVATRWAAVRPAHLAPNRGQAAALWHGFHSARGRWVAMLDGDGQNPPGELARLWAVRESADMIAGARMNRQDSRLRRVMSRVANAARRAALRDGVTDTGCSLKVFRREVVGSFLPIRTMYSFLPAFAVAGGWTVREVPVAHRARTAGVSKYGFGVMAIHPTLDLIALSWILRRTFRQRSERSAVSVNRS